MSSGETFLGKFPTHKGRVLFLELDMPENLFQERWKMAQPHLKNPENIFIIPWHPIDILDPDTQDTLKAAIDDIDPVLIFFDTLRKLHREKENENEVPMQVYDAIKKCIGEDRAAIVIHHDRKSIIMNKGSKKDTDKDDFEAPDEFVETFRGARAWIDDCDLGIQMYKYGASNRVKMSYSKVRCKPLPPMFLQLNSETLLIENKEPQNAREWASKIYSENIGISNAEWAKKVQESANVSKVRAGQIIGELLVEMSE